jgi:hypothetical protein
MDWLLDLLGLNKGKATIDAANQNKDILARLGIDLNNIIDTTDARQTGYLNQSNDLASMGPNAAGILGDIYGLNGADGSARARSAFTEAPGYQYALDQSEQALMRRNSALGNLQSGGTSMDLQANAVGLANQGWNDWINGITGGIDRQIGTLGDLATQAGNTGATQLGVTSGIGSGLMGANNQVASGKEAGQGAIWDLFNNIAGVAGSAFGLNSGGGAGIGGSSAGTKMGYGRGF